MGLTETFEVLAKQSEINVVPCGIIPGMSLHVLSKVVSVDMEANGYTNPTGLSVQYPG